MDKLGHPKADLSQLIPKNTSDDTARKTEERERRTDFWYQFHNASTEDVEKKKQNFRNDHKQCEQKGLAYAPEIGTPEVGVSMPPTFVA